MQKYKLKTITKIISLTAVSIGISYGSCNIRAYNLTPLNLNNTQIVAQTQKQASSFKNLNPKSGTLDWNLSKSGINYCDGRYYMITSLSGIIHPVKTFQQQYHNDETVLIWESPDTQELRTSWLDSKYSPWASGKFRRFTITNNSTETIIAIVGGEKTKNIKGICADQKNTTDCDLSAKSFTIKPEGKQLITVSGFNLANGDIPINIKTNDKKNYINTIWNIGNFQYDNTNKKLVLRNNEIQVIKNNNTSLNVNKYETDNNYFNLEFSVSYPAWDSKQISQYTPGTIVSHNNKLWQCKPAPEGSWCSSPGYEPGSFYGSVAWTEMN